MTDVDSSATVAKTLTAREARRKLGSRMTRKHERTARTRPAKKLAIKLAAAKRKGKR